MIEESLGYLINRVARQMAHQLSEAIRPDGVGTGQWAILLFLWARDGMSQAELARMVAIEPPTMVRTIDRMVRDGPVTRVADPSDGRVTRIHLTIEVALREVLVPKAVAVNEANIARLTPAEAATLRRSLTKLLDPSGRHASEGKLEKLLEAGLLGGGPSQVAPRHAERRRRSVTTERSRPRARSCGVLSRAGPMMRRCLMRLASAANGPAPSAYVVTTGCIASGNSAIDER